MRYYFINSEKEETQLDISSLSFDQAGFGTFTVSFNEQVKELFVKKLATKLYLSHDKINWKKIAPITSFKTIVNINDVLSVYRGFKPSGLSDANAGALVTDMPGKVVTVLVNEGDTVEKGQTLLILEAMKMENEMKAGVSGTIQTIHVKDGQTLDSGHLMIEIEE